MQEALKLLRRVPRNQVILLDGFLVGAGDPDGFAQVAAPLVGVVHHPLCLEAGLSPDRAAFLRENERNMLAGLAHVIVTSPHTAGLLNRDFDVPIEKITIATPGFTRPETSPSPITPPLILSVGLLAERKGHDVLLNALARIMDLPWQARIVGKVFDPDVHRSLLAQSLALGLAHRVEFAGELSDRALQAEFSAASVFALATRYEGYGMALNEAMQYDLPVVSCDTGAVSETVGGAGLLVPVDDAEGFASALRALLTDHALRTRQQAESRARAQSLPSWDETARTVTDLIRRLRINM
ncbi:MAG: glycosyltransferase family 4 protein [Phaeobacter italicus]